MRVTSANLQLASQSETTSRRIETAQVRFFDDRRAVSLDFSSESLERMTRAEARRTARGSAPPPPPSGAQEPRSGGSSAPPARRGRPVAQALSRLAGGGLRAGDLARRDAGPLAAAGRLRGASSRPPPPAAGASEVEGSDELDEFLKDGSAVELFTLKAMLEKITGRSFRVARRRDFELTGDQQRRLDETARRAQGAQSAEAAAQAPEQPPQRVGFGLEITRESRVERHERVSVQAAGVVRTQDGREISLATEVAYERHEVQVESSSLRIGDARLKDPLVLVFDGSTAQLGSQVKLDLDGDGAKEDVALATGNAAFLVHDRNQNGRVDDGTELFGAASGDGFAELAALDDDENGFVDEGDSSFQHLYLWEGRTSTGDALTALAARGVGALHVESVASPFELRDDSGALQGAIRETGVFLEEDGGVGLLQQIDLVV